MKIDALLRDITAGLDEVLTDCQSIFEGMTDEEIKQFVSRLSQSDAEAIYKYRASLWPAHLKREVVNAMYHLVLERETEKTEQVFNEVLNTFASSPFAPDGGKVATARLIWEIVRVSKAEATTAESLNQMLPKYQAEQAFLYERLERWYNAIEAEADRQAKQSLNVDWALNNIMFSYKVVGLPKNMANTAKVLDGLLHDAIEVTSGSIPSNNLACGIVEKLKGWLLTAGATGMLKMACWKKGVSVEQLKEATNLLRDGITARAGEWLLQIEQTAQVEHRANHEKQAIPLPDGLNNDRARKVFERAVLRGFMEITPTGYKWMRLNERGQKVRLCYLIGLLCGTRFATQGNKWVNMGSDIPEKALNKYFGITGIRKAITQLSTAQKPQQWYEEIEELMQEQAPQK